jgi:tol-pal system protein YbgF
MVAGSFQDTDVNIKHPGSIAIFWVVLSVGVSPAVAQSTSERLQLIEERLSRLERIVDNKDSATTMLKRIQELQTENQSLRNEVETLQFETVQSADRERQLYLDLDQRLQALEAGGAAAANAAGASGAGSGAAGAMPANNGAAPSGAAGTEQDAYAAAFDALKQGKYQEAEAGFRGFLEAYPGSELRDNAEYWLAETYYVTEDFPKALTGFQNVINNYPASRKIPDAWLKIGYCNYELQKWDDARQALTTAESRYPESTAAKLASQRLEQMRAEGH